MRRLLLFVVATVMSATLAMAATCTTDTLAAYLALGATGCDVATPFGTATLSDFTTSSSVSGTFDAATIAPTLITVNPFFAANQLVVAFGLKDGTGADTTFFVINAEGFVLQVGYNVRSAQAAFTGDIEGLLGYGVASPPAMVAQKDGPVLQVSTGTISLTKNTFVKFGGAPTPGGPNPLVLDDGGNPFPTSTDSAQGSFGQSRVEFFAVDTLTMNANGGSATVTNFENRYDVVLCATHTTHGHLPGVPDGHDLDSHVHHGQHGHIIDNAGLCYPHADGHTPGMKPEQDSGESVSSLNSQSSPIVGLAVNQDGSFNGAPGQGATASAVRPATRGSVLQLFGTSPGIVFADSGKYKLSELTPVVQIGSAQAQVLYSGLMPGSKNVWQLNVRVPSDAPVGSDVHVKVVYGGQELGSVDVAIQ